MATTKKALNYVKNAGGNATYTSFVSDYAPVGHKLYEEVAGNDLITADTGGHLHLTEKGKIKLEELEDGGT